MQLMYRTRWLLGMNRKLITCTSGQTVYPASSVDTYLSCYLAR